MRALLLSMILCAAAHADERLTVDGRPFLVHAPETKKAAPLLVVLHPFGGDAASMLRAFGVLEATDPLGFVVAAPDGLVDRAHHRYWNATPACCDFDKSGVDDLAYLRHLIAAVRARYHIDRRRIYAFGYSNGGFMSHRLACELSPEIAAIASVAGAAPEACHPREKVAILQVHGDADEVVPPSGGALGGGLPRLARFPAPFDSLKGWARFDGCAKAIVEGDVMKWPCGVELWTLPGVGHSLSPPAGFMRRVLRFLLDHPKR
jgi:polyhydroxybutyrate depolymerase